MTEIINLKPRMYNVDVVGVIQEVGVSRKVITKDGLRSEVATATLKDDSGHISLVLWNEQIDDVKNGEEIKVVNGYTTRFKDETILNVGRYGELVHIKPYQIPSESEVSFNRRD